MFVFFLKCYDSPMRHMDCFLQLTLLSQSVRTSWSLFYKARWEYSRSTGLFKILVLLILVLILAVWCHLHLDLDWFWFWFDHNSGLMLLSQWRGLMITNWSTLLHCLDYFRMFLCMMMSQMKQHVSMTKWSLSVAEITSKIVIIKEWTY